MLLTTALNKKKSTFIIDSLGWQVSVNEQSIIIRFNGMYNALSSAIYNGGMKKVSHFINLRVDSENSFICSSHEVTKLPPEKFIGQILKKLHLPSKSIGMMTAASMKSLQIVEKFFLNESICVVLTSGIANARCVGDFAEHREIYAPITEIGTINILIGTTLHLSEAAMVEVIMMVAEAKAAVFQELNILSPTSGKVATGTGTDSTGIVSVNNPNKPEVAFVGKHTIVGETLANAVMQALKKSLNYPCDIA